MSKPANGEQRNRADSESQLKKKQPKRATKSDAVVALLSRSRGATIDEMMKATAWQSHSVRGFLAGTVKKKQRRAVTSEITDKGRVYRIIAETK
ncbi:MAG: DUF3489 domain-containing protein [Erythrobacter sp.]|nr:DUF3489 domain-containing protein [Erythrobacter sp.]